MPWSSSESPEPGAELAETGPQARPSYGGRALRLVVGLAVIVALAVVVARLPSDTQTATLIMRGAVGLAIGLLLVVLVTRMLRALTAPQAAAPAPVDARPADVVYECPVCAMRVRLETATTAKPPKHCGEEMAARIS